MISERKLAMSHSSLWLSVCPLMERFVREVNSERTEEFGHGVEPKCKRERHAFVSELSLLLLAGHGEGLLDLEKTLARDVVRPLVETANKRIDALEGSNGESLGRVTAQEIQEGQELAHWIVELAKVVGHPLVCSPYFPGCGYLSTCRGDLLAGTALLEVKAVTRSFRNTDIRQVLLYAVLNHLAESYDVKMLGLANPRQGTYFLCDLDDLSDGVAGVAFIELAHRIVHALSSSELSK